MNWITKIISFPCAFLVGMIAFVNCDKGDDTVITDSVSISVSSLVFEAAGGSQSIIVTSGSKWTVSGYFDWCVPSVTHGETGSTVIFSVTENKNSESREASFVFTSGQKKATLLITQKKKTVFDISPSNINIDQGGGDIEVTVKTNIDYRIYIQDDWISYKGTKSVLEKVLQFAVSENETLESREGSIILSDGTLSDTIEISQAGGEIFVLSQDEYDVSDKGDTITVELRCNVEYEVTVPNVNWISELNTKTVSTYTKQYIISANTTYDSRSAIIVFCSKNSGACHPVMVKQAANNEGNNEGLNKDDTLNLELKIISVTDAVFKSYLVEHFDMNNDREIDTREALKIKKITVNTDHIESLVGIEYFSNLTSLVCNGTGWDASSSSTKYGSLKSLDISQNHLLETVTCNYNKEMTNLAVGENTALTSLKCYITNISSIDVSKCPSLDSLQLSHNTFFGTVGLGGLGSLSALDISKNTNLRWLDCSCQQLSVLDLNRNVRLRVLYCTANKISALDVHNCSALVNLNLSYNPINYLDISQNTALRTLEFQYTNISDIDLSNNTALQYLFCYRNNLTNLDVSKNTSLDYISCYECDLKTLDISNNPELSRLLCYGNDLLPDIDISNNKKLYLFWARLPENTDNSHTNPHLETVWVWDGFNAADYPANISSWSGFCIPGGAEYKILSEHSVFRIAQTEYNVSNAEQIIEVRITTNCDYSVHLPEVNWLSELTTKSLDTHTHYFKVLANTGSSTRNAVISFCSESNCYSVTVTQAANTTGGNEGLGEDEKLFL